MKKIICVLVSIIFTVFLASCNVEDGIINDNKTNTATDNVNNDKTNITTDNVNNNKINTDTNNFNNITTDNNQGNITTDNNNHLTDSNRNGSDTLGGILTSDADMLVSDTLRNSDRNTTDNIG